MKKEIQVDEYVIALKAILFYFLFYFLKSSEVGTDYEAHKGGFYVGLGAKLKTTATRMFTLETCLYFFHPSTRFF